MWHELVLAGIGGQTVTEAKERMPYREFLQWRRYRQKRGTLNLGLRMDRGSALLAMLYANAKSGKAKYRIWDFLPHEDEPAITLEQAMKQWQ